MLLLLENYLHSFANIVLQTIFKREKSIWTHLGQISLEIRQVEKVTLLQRCHITFHHFLQRCHITFHLYLAYLPLA